MTPGMRLSMGARAQSASGDEPGGNRPCAAINPQERAIPVKPAQLQGFSPLAGAIMAFQGAGRSVRWRFGLILCLYLAMFMAVGRLMIGGRENENRRNRPMNNTVEMLVWTRL